MVELLYTGRTSLGVDQILEAHNMAKLLGLNVTLEHRSVNDERRRQVRLEKDSGGGGYDPAKYKKSPSRSRSNSPIKNLSESGKVLFSITFLYGRLVIRSE